MQSYLTNIRGAIALTAIISAIGLAGCSDSDTAVGTSQVRIIHTSPDAPPVNVKLDGITAVSDLDYAESSGFERIVAGIKDIAVEAIIPGGNADVITVNDFNFTINEQFTIMAVNNTAGIEALVVSDSATTPASSEVAVAVVHASPAAGQVDVYVTTNGVDINSVSPNLTFDFKQSVDVGALPADTYQIRVTGTGSKTVVYDSGAVDLTPFAGQKLLISAISTTNATSQAASPVKLLISTSGSSLVLLDSGTQVGARVVHLSPDAGTAAGGSVEVFASSTALGPNPVELIDAFSYTEIVPAADSYVSVPTGDYVFDVAPDTGSIGDSVYTSPSLALSAGVEYSLIASGYVTATPAFELLPTADDNRSIATQAGIKVIHAAPAAGTVDVYVTTAGAFSSADVQAGLAGEPLLNDFAYGEITDYVSVVPGSYDVRVVAGGAVAINIEGFNLAAGSVSSIIARQPIDVGVPADFNVVVLTN